MGLPEGKTNNHRGRPRGSQNKANKELRELVKEFLQRKMEDIDSLFDELPAREKAKFVTELLSYSMPKYQPLEFEKKEIDDNLSPVEFFQSINQQYISKYGKEDSKDK